MKFKPGDLVMILATQHEIPIAFCRAGTVGTVISICSCAHRDAVKPDEVYWRLDLPDAPKNVSVCVDETILRKIDDPGRQVVEWDWTELKTQEEVPA